MTRIAMWSGPRNISTAMMRAWENRTDTTVVDEPFYACYLSRVEDKHPMQEEILASQSSHWSTVIENELNKPLVDPQKIQYQKHMTHHMVEEIDQDWFANVQHAFLIRDPAEVVRSYVKKMEIVTAEDIGFARQLQLYENAKELSNKRVPVIDAKDVLTDPKLALSLLCDALNVEFDSDMLNWPVGLRDTDGVWAPHWYNQVAESVCFASWKEKKTKLTLQQQIVVDECMPHYQQLFANRITLN